MYLTSEEQNSGRSFFLPQKVSQWHLSHSPSFRLPRKLNFVNWFFSSQSSVSSPCPLASMTDEVPHLLWMPGHTSFAQHFESCTLQVGEYITETLSMKYDSSYIWTFALNHLDYIIQSITSVFKMWWHRMIRTVKPYTTIVTHSQFQRQTLLFFLIFI